MDESGVKKLLEFLLKESKKPKPFDDYKKAKKDKREKKYLEDEGFTAEEIAYITGGDSATNVSVDIPPQPPIVWQPPTVWQ